MSGIRSTSVGADLGHWKAYAAKNNSTSKGATGESPGVKLATPTTKKATGGAVKKRADRFARGGRALERLRHHVTGAIERGEKEAIRGIPKGSEEEREYNRDLARRIREKGSGPLETPRGSETDTSGPGWARGGAKRAKRAAGGRLTAGACTGEGREEKAAMYKRG